MTGALLERLTGPPGVGFDPPPGGSRARWLLIGVAVIFWLAVVIVGLIGLASGRSGHPGWRAAVPRPPQPAAASTRSSPGPGLVWHAPATAIPNGSPAQEQYDQVFSNSLGSLAGMDAAQALAVPVPTVGGGWPSLPLEVTPERWTAAFVDGLLDVDYARQSRVGLSAWLQAQEAPELLPGVRPAVADKVLEISVLDPALFGGQPTSVPSPVQWGALTRAGVRQTVSDVLVQADPDWHRMIAAGWQPADLRMTEDDVTGRLTVHQGGRVTTHHFALQVIVGSARWHDGYGTVAVSGWQEQ